MLVVVPSIAVASEARIPRKAYGLLLWDMYIVWHRDFVSGHA